MDQMSSLSMNEKNLKIARLEIDSEHLSMFVRSVNSKNSFEIQDGEKIGRHENGKIQSICIWKNKPVNGIYQYFYDSGNIGHIYVYKNSSRNGSVISFKYEC